MNKTTLLNPHAIETVSTLERIAALAKTAHDAAQQMTAALAELDLLAKPLSEQAGVYADDEHCDTLTPSQRAAYNRLEVALISATNHSYNAEKMAERLEGMDQLAGKFLTCLSKM